jgi:hypothetical protein
MHFSLIKLGTAATGFDDVILFMYHALKRLGFTVEIRNHGVNPHSRNIIFGSGSFRAAKRAAFPNNSIVFNLEQLTESSPWLNSDYMRYLATYDVWDYSPRNTAFLQNKMGFSNVVCIRLGYVPEMTRLNSSRRQDVDVLFYGGINDRRRAVLLKLLKAGVNLHVLLGSYGAARDSWIVRSKIVLNTHYFTPANLEMARLGYLWANKKTVLSELGPETEHYPELAAACRYSAYEDLAEAAVDLLADDRDREKQAEAGYRAFSSISLTDELKSIVGCRTFAVQS